MKQIGALDAAIGDVSVGESHGQRVRPYTLTGGRTRPSADLAIETLVIAKPGDVVALGARRLGPEHARALSLAAEPSSVAELSARLATPLGVARVLVGDLLAAGLVELSEPAVRTDRPDVQLLERVLHGIQAL